ncbi:MAG: hypothetical protein KatS3mg105_0687 [Gemmatales bacterium]|nr:MAG: hypothetical protein KatS3mg105_0687 [Gemmatales bacterium]
MKARPIRFCLALLLSFLTCSLTWADPAKPKGLKRSLVVSGQGYFPVAIRLQDKRIAVVLRGGAPHLGIKGRLDIVFSEDEGKTWSKPIVVNDSPVDDRNPAFGQAANGDLVVGFWRTANYDDKGRYDPNLDKPRNTWVTRSSDGGKTWSEAVEIDVSDIGWGSPFGKILTLPDQSMLMAIYGGPVQTKDNKVQRRQDHSYVYRSIDHGKTWRRYGECSNNMQLNETALLALPSGKLLAAMRARAGGVWLASSDDGGKSWSQPKRITPANVHPADLILLPDRRILLTVGYRLKPFGVRGLISDAKGEFNWEDHFVLVDDAIGGDCGYPSSVLLQDGRVLTVYYATRVTTHRPWGIHCGALIYHPRSE